MHFPDCFRRKEAVNGVTALNAVFGGILSVIDKPAFRKEAALDFRSNFFAAQNRVMVERGKNNLLFKSEFADHVNNALFNRRILKNSGFELNVCDNVGILDKLKVFAQGRNFVEAVNALEACGVIKPAQLFKGHVPDKTLTVCGALDVLIVDNYKYVVLGKVDVKLNTVAADFDRFFKSEHCVFGIFARKASVSKNF